MASMIDNVSTVQHAQSETTQAPSERQARSRSSLRFLQERLERWTISSRSSQPETGLQPVKVGKGPLGLNLLHEPSEPQIDFIFIHGLNGGSHKTWSHTPDPTMFWPKMWLPNEPGFSHVRVHSFGYSADWNTRQDSRLTIHDFGQALLADMSNSPTLKNDNTPIVIVSHSMGGLVAKKAYLLATRDPMHHPIAQRIKTMFFLATPHRGADSAQLAKLLRYSPNYGSKAFMADLLPGSGTLDVINDEFRHVCDRIHLWSFFETIPTKFGFMTTLVVDKTSAVLGMPKEHVQFMEATHRDICKFDSPTNPNYITLQRAFLTTIEAIEANVESEHRHDYPLQMKKIALYLRVNQDPEAIQLAINQKQQKGSCQWLTDSSTFQAWLATAGQKAIEGVSSEPGATESSHKALWLTGRPGTGKSVASSHVVQYLQSLGLDCCYYFFRHDNRLGATISAFLRSLAFQIAACNFEARQVLASMVADEININHDDHNILWLRIFKERLLKVNYKRAQYWVLDGIDECTNNDLSGLVSMLSEVDRRVPFSIFMASRPGGHLARLLARAEIPYSEIQTGQEGSNQDIELFLRSNCSFFGSAEAFDEFVSEILAKSNSSFLWVSLTAAKLEDAYSVEDKQAVLEQIPVGMDGFYARIIASFMDSPSFELIKCVLGWVVCASRPLTIPELTEAVLLDAKRTLTASPSQLESMTGHLIHVDSQSQVHITHQTTLAFLTQEREDFWLDTAAAHSRIAETCLGILCSSDFAPPRRRRGGTISRATSHSILSDYAALNFSYHLTYSSQSLGTPHALIQTFFGSHVLTWIEKLASSGRLWVVLATVNRLKAYIDGFRDGLLVRGEFQTIRFWATDLYHVVSAFHSNLITSPSSIHWFIPYLCPPSSMVRQIVPVLNRGPRIVGPLEKYWSERSMSFALSDEASAIACSSRFFAIGLTSGNVHIYHNGGSHNLRLAATLTHEKKLRQLAFTESSSLLACCSARRLAVWELVTENTLQLTCRWTHDLTFTPSSLTFGVDGSTVLLTDPQNSAIISFNLVSGHLVEPSLLRALLDDESSDEDEPMNGWTPPNQITLDSAHTLAAMSYHNSTVLIWDLETREKIGVFEREGLEGEHVSPQALDMVFNPVTDLELLAISYHDGDIVTCNPWMLEQVCRVELPTSLSNLTVTTDGRILAGVADDGGIYLFLFDGLKPLSHISELDGSSRINSICFSADNLRLFDVRGKSCNVWEPLSLVLENRSDPIIPDIVAEDNTIPEKSLSHAHEFCWGEAITTIEPAGDSGYIFAGRQDGSVDVFESKTGNLLIKSQPHASVLEVWFLQWNEAKQILLSLDTSCGYALTEVQGLSGEAQPTLTSMLKGRETSFIRQAFFDLKAENLFIRTDAVVKALRLDGTTLHVVCTSSNTWWRMHPSDPSKVIKIQDDGISCYAWPSLQHISTNNFRLGTAIQYCREDTWTTNGNTSFVVQRQSRPGLKGELTVIDLTDTPENGDIETFFLQSSGLNMQKLLGLMKTTLFFLDTGGWICSINIKTLREATHYTRHFFIPPTWRTGSEVMVQVLSKSAVAYGRGEQLVVFHGFLEYEEKISFSIQ